MSKTYIALRNGKKRFGKEVLRDGCGGIGIRLSDGGEYWYQKCDVEYTHEPKEVIDEKWEKLNRVMMRDDFS